ncbi:MAG: tetratricopeptide repeat protein [Ruminococcaceae bacterium]|nr:tetratricopeptide repeat protein [Oscillospiraceae bacterium]
MDERDYMENACPFDVSAWRKVPQRAGKRIDLGTYLARYDALMARGEKKDAGAVLYDALCAAREHGDRHSELSLCSELMGYCRQAGCREEGMEAIEAGLHLLRELGLEGSLTAGTILVNAATALSAFGEHQRALGNFQEAFRCYGRALPPEDQRWAALLNNMAAAYEARGERDSAERHYRSALRIQQLGGGVDVAVTHVNLAQLLGSRDEWEAALAALDEPTLVWDEYYAFTCRKCAAAFEEAGMAETAQELRERAEIIHESD